MGLFDKLGGGAKALTPKSAMALAAMTVIGVDGVVEDTELEGLRHVVRGDDDAFNRACAVYKDKSVSDCIPLVSAALDEKQKTATLANLLDLAMADGILAGAEKVLLEAYVHSFGLPEEVVSSLVDVIAIKNDFSIFG
jgi:uncharacterized tellurite resistance protein B-like protein